MPFPIIFAQLAGGVQPLSDFDTMFNTVGNMATIFCTASGSNSIALAPIANMPTVAAYTNYQAFGFVATATSTGSVTLNVSGLGALPAYASDGATQLASGGVNTGIYYVFTYNSALNSGSGGFQILGSNGSGGFKTSVNIQTFTSGSGTYTPSTNTSVIVVEMVGGGGGGGGSGTSGAGNGGTGGTTTFGTSLLSCTGGSGGLAGADGGAGGTASLGSGPIGNALTGAQGGGRPTSTISGLFTSGGIGGSSPFGGAGAGVVNGTAVAGATNTGSGGAGGGNNTAGTYTSSGGGGAGGYIRALITSLAATYSYSVGAAGAAGAGGTSGFGGAAGGSGVIIVTEYINTPSALVSGFINSGTTGQIPYYAASGSTLSSTNALPNGTTATTQATGDASGYVATTAFVKNTLLVTPLGVGSFILAQNNTGSNIGAGSSTAASNIKNVGGSNYPTGTLNQAGDILSGTWVTMQGLNTSSFSIGLWQRIA